MRWVILNQLIPCWFDSSVSSNEIVPVMRRISVYSQLHCEPLNSAHASTNYDRSDWGAGHSRNTGSDGDDGYGWVYWRDRSTRHSRNTGIYRSYRCDRSHWRDRSHRSYWSDREAMSYRTYRRDWSDRQYGSCWSRWSYWSDREARSYRTYGRDRSDRQHGSCWSDRSAGNCRSKGSNRCNWRRINGASRSHWSNGIGWCGCAAREGCEGQCAGDAGLRAGAIRDRDRRMENPGNGTGEAVCSTNNGANTFGGWPLSSSTWVGR